MIAALLCMTVAWGVDPSIVVSTSPATTLYVRTTPPGAQIFANGRTVGESNGLFPMSPGTVEISIKLEGFDAEVRRVEIVAQEVTRLVLELKKASHGPAARTAAGSLDAAKVAPLVAEFVNGKEIPATVRDAMLTVLRQHPDALRWSGRSGTSLFALAAKPLPGGAAGQRAVPAVLELTQMLAIQDLLKAKGLLERYADAGLTDATTLAQAMDDVAGRLNVVGKVQGADHRAAVCGGFAIAYVTADQSQLASHLLSPASLDEVRAAYRDAMHRQARQLMQQSNWKDALLLWQHLHKRKLVSQRLYLDAARCFQQLGEEQDALRVLSEAMQVFDKVSDPEFFECAGDVAIAMKSEAAQRLADKAYRAASEQLRETTSSAPPHTLPAEQP